jgi:hypothetical protein
MRASALPSPAARHERADTILRLVAKDGARLAMRGTSMLPMLREGMVLRVADGKPRIGDVVIFRQNDILTAHRVIARTLRGVRTAGDNQPLVVEDVAHDEILAIVDAVYGSDLPDAPRIDTTFFRWRGQLYGRCHAANAFAARVRALVSAGAQFAFPWQRPRAAPALLDALGSIVRNDPDAFLGTLGDIPAQRFADLTVRHRCETPILNALRAHDEAPARAVRDLLAPVVRRDAVVSMLQRPHVVALVKTLTSADVPFALLKGAARAFSSDGSQAHASCDIDVLVPPPALEATIAALRRSGYSFRYNDALQRHYLRTHHHAAPLFPPGPGPAIEVHTSLALPGTLGLRTDWDALASHLVKVESDDGAAYCFDRFASALHYAIHGIGFERLRDIFFCAQLLLELSDEQRAELQHLAASDAIDPVRFGASLALAARFAGLPWAIDRRTRRYLDWAVRREDMPTALRTRTYGVEAWFVAGCGTSLRRDIALLNEPSQTQLAGRIALTPVALAYAAAMRPH